MNTDDITTISAEGGTSPDEANFRKGEDAYARIIALQERMLSTQQTHFETTLSNERSHTEALRAEALRGHRNAVSHDNLSTLRQLDTGIEEAVQNAIQSRAQTAADVNVAGSQIALNRLIEAIVPVVVERLREGGDGGGVA